METGCPIPAEPEQVVAAYQNTVYRLAYAYTRKRSDAEDVFQEVFMRYFRAARPFESAEHQKAWLIRVTINCAKKQLSSAWTRHRARLTEEIAFPAREETGLYEALGKLSPKYRSVIHLYYGEGYAAQEIAGILQCQPSTVRAQLTRARQRLAKQLKEDGYDA